MEFLDHPTKQDGAENKEQGGNYCSRCGAKNPDNCFICQSCGSRLIEDILSSGGKLQAVNYRDVSHLLAKQLEGRYEILGEIGRGGMSIVYKARDVLLDRIAAIKVLPIELTVDKKLVERFMQEARLAAKLHHPNIVTIFSVRQDNDLNYMIMNYIEGQTINQLLKAQGPFTVPLALQIARDVLKALSKAHELGIVHRDIKPDNILITPSNSAIVTDFGIAQAIAQRKYAKSLSLVGTAHYMSPEQIKGVMDHRGDLYSLGIVIYKMLTAKVPFTGDDMYVVSYKHLEEAPPAPRTFNPAIPPIVEDLILKAMAKQPEERFQTALEMISAIDRVELFVQQEEGKEKSPLDEMPASDIKHLMSVAQRSLDNSENEKAVIMLRKALALDPNCTEAELLLLTARKRITAPNQRPAKDEPDSRPAPTEPRPVEENSQIREVLEVAGKREFGKAIHLLELLLRKEPNNARASALLEETKEKARIQIRLNKLYEEGFNCYINSQYEQAIARWSEILEIDPQFNDAREFIATAQRELDKTNKLESLREHGRQAVAAGKVREGLTTWQEVLTLFPDDQEALEHIGRLASSLEKLNQQDMILAKARTYLKDLNFEEARSLVLEVINENHQNEDALYLLEQIKQATEHEVRYDELLQQAEAAQRDNKFRNAIRLYEQALELHPDSKSILEAVQTCTQEESLFKKQRMRQNGIKLANRGRFVEALKVWLQAFATIDDADLFLDPIRKTLERIKDPEILNLFRLKLARKLADLEDYPEALALIKLIPGQDPSYAGANKLMDAIQQQRHSHERKKEELVERAEALIAVGELSEAVLLLEDAVRASNDQNVIDLYVQVKNSIEEQVELTARQFQEAVEAEDLDAARQALAGLKKADPYDERVDDLETQLNELISRMQETQRMEIPLDLFDAGEDLSVVNLCESLMEEGQYDRAKEHLDRFLEQHPSHEKALSLLDRLEVALEIQENKVSATDSVTMIERTESTDIGEETAFESSQPAQSEPPPRWQPRDQEVDETGPSSLKKQRKSSKATLMVLVGLVITGIAVLGYLGYGQWRDRKVMSLYEAGVTHFNSGRYEDCISAMLQVHGLKPDYQPASVYIDRANLKISQAQKQVKNQETIDRLLVEIDALTRQGNLQLSLQKVKEILELEPQNSEARKLRQLLEMDIESAERKKNFNSSLTRAQELIAKAQYTDAIILLEELKAENPDSPEVETLLNRAQKASASVEAQRERAQRIESLVTAAKTDSAAGRIVEAYDSATKALILDPKNGDALAIKQRLEPQVNALKHEQNLKVQEANLMNNARKAIAAENYETALKNLNELLALIPDHAEAQKLQKQTKAKYDEISKSEAELKELTDYIAKAKALNRDNRFQEALEYINKALKMAPDKPELTTLRDTAMQGIAMSDRTPPEIRIHEVAKGKVGQALKVKASVSDNQGIASVSLHYKPRKKGSFTIIAMTLTENNVYQAEIPGSAIPAGGLTIQVSATDKSRNQIITPTVDVEVDTPAFSTGLF